MGVVAIVSEDGRDVTIINLKDLTFSSMNSVLALILKTHMAVLRTLLCGVPKIKRQRIYLGLKIFPTENF